MYYLMMYLHKRKMKKKDVVDIKLIGLFYVRSNLSREVKLFKK